MFAFGCLDWTERRYHLGGALGAAFLVRLTKDGVVHHRNETRALGQRGAVEAWVNALDRGRLRVEPGQ